MANCKQSPLRVSMFLRERHLALLSRVPLWALERMVRSSAPLHARSDADCSLLTRASSARATGVVCLVEASSTVSAALETTLCPHVVNDGNVIASTGGHAITMGFVAKVARNPSASESIEREYATLAALWQAHVKGIIGQGACDTLPSLRVMPNPCAVAPRPVHVGKLNSAIRRPVLAELAHRLPHTLAPLRAELLSGLHGAMGPGLSRAFFVMQRCSSSLYDRLALDSHFVMTRRRPAEQNGTQQLTFASRMRSSDTVGIALPLFQRLHDLHSAGYVHGDLKPVRRLCNTGRTITQQDACRPTSLSWVNANRYSLATWAPPTIGKNT
jgi:hypothetical protein